eukprot:TRINITY_DN66038_c0_g1_i1.p1 TRINITY_DN66038_c0_g1~~TRINITY_DN66038_c0_g1_i1.p1  ORF type:complete len:442 (-),score=87.81 TRINITY_DN66038_c0_g1_i1:43-1188(-)
MLCPLSPPRLMQRVGGYARDVQAHNRVFRAIAHIEPGPSVSRLNFFEQRSAPDLLALGVQDVRGGGRQSSGRPASPLAKKVGKRRMSAVIDARDISNKAAKEKEIQNEVLRRLQDMLDACLGDGCETGISSSTLAALIGEVSEGMCSVQFEDDGALERTVTVHSIRVTRKEDGHVLCQVGKWRPRHGFLSRCQLPGNKRPTGSDFDAYVQLLIRDELADLLEGGQVTFQGSSSQKMAKRSAQFGVPTTYQLLTKHAVLTSSTSDADSTTSSEEASARHRVLLSAAMDDTDDHLAGVEAHLLLREHSEIDVYAWLPAILADHMETDYDVKQVIQSWTEGFAESVARMGQEAFSSAFSSDSEGEAQPRRRLSKHVEFSARPAL